MDLFPIFLTVFSMLSSVIGGAILFQLKAYMREHKANKKEALKKQAAIEDGLRQLLRNDIIQIYEDAMEKEEIDISLLDDAERLYNAYKGLHGNHGIEKIMEEIYSIHKR